MTNPSTAPDSETETGTLPPPGQDAHPGHPRPVRLHGPDIARDPAGLYRTLQQRYGPVVPVLLDGDIPAWFVLGYREVSQVTANPRQFARDCRRWNAWDLIPGDWPLMPYVGWTPSVMFAEGPEHQRRAGAIGDSLDAVDRTELVRMCRRVATELIGAFSLDGEADLVAQYSHRIPLHVMARLYGLAEADIPLLVADIAESLDVGDKAVQAHRRIHARMRGLVEAKHRRPGPDLPSRLIGHSAALSDDEIVIDLLVVMAAAQQPTGNWIGNGLRLMLVDDRFTATLQGGRDSVGQALNEALWEDTPTQNFIGRWAVHDCALGGQRIRRGDLLVLGLAAANTDLRVRPETHPGPGANRAHLSFGRGEHGCPYPAPDLASTIASTAVETLLDRLPDVRISVPAEELTWRPSVWMRGLFALPVAFSPIAGAATEGDGAGGADGGGRGEHARSAGG
ncbi:cytochrome P450 [Actinomadura xylanilytica]|uniref:cytochrome P450 n=1 Tax=Actinomadura xylanilytica TaxID=887459 RepID=UPI00255AD337|nr:cytochrome P450 [Actinomadura xylanilytica]MDL4775487.1 cytochrome P450 [Actinomadura xylanilytica]